jgi:hypothetical protein
MKLLKQVQFDLSYLTAGREIIIHLHSDKITYTILKAEMYDGLLLLTYARVFNKEKEMASKPAHELFRLLNKEMEYASKIYTHHFFY